METINRKFNELKNTHSDINEHLPVLKRYAEECDTAVEFGVRGAVSTWALLCGIKKKLTSYDLNYHRNIKEVEDAGKSKFQFIKADDLKIEIEETDLLFIDTWHCAHQLRKELKLHAKKVRKYLIFHDTYTFGEIGEDGTDGLKMALNEFLDDNPEWTIKEQLTNNNGLTVLQRGIVRKNKVKFIIPIPDLKYYLWQALVQINNFRKLGYEIDAHYPVITFGGKNSSILDSFINSKNIKAHFHVYPDTRKNIVYPASMKPWMMAQYFKEFPEEKNTAYVYLDADCIFLEPMNWDSFLKDSEWYESDTRSYLNSAYIKSKSPELFKEMCEIIGVTTGLVENNDQNTGGAQYVIKNNTFDFWDEVQSLSSKLYAHMKNTEKKYTPKGGIPIQSWTAEMWATNWIAWKHGIRTNIHKDLEFHWANHRMKDKKHSIFHNAGIPKPDGKNFSKTDYQSSPFKKEITCTEASLSYLYKLEVLNTERNFNELIWE